MNPLRFGLVTMFFTRLTDCCPREPLPTRCPTDQKETQLGGGVVAGGPNCVAGKLRLCHPPWGVFSWTIWRNNVMWVVTDEAFSKYLSCCPPNRIMESVPLSLPRIGHYSGSVIIEQIVRPSHCLWASDR